MISLNENLETPKIDSTLEDLIHAIFQPKGWAENVLHLEHRPQQETMARHVSLAMSEDFPLLFEAGTGVGKSLAYLIPGIIQSIETKRPFLVSTHTKALQEQIAYKDLAICRELFKAVPELHPYAEFKTAILMGKGNYLCTTRLAQAIASRSELFHSEQQDDFERLCEWSAITEKGLIEEIHPALNSEVWEWVNADSSTCSKKNCSKDDCFYQKAKAQIQAAQVTILNHSLLFSLIGSGMTQRKNLPGILFPEDFLVLDEAHTIPEIATEHFGLRTSSYALERALKILYNPRRNKGLLKTHGKTADCNKIVTALSATAEFFNAIKQKYLQKNDTVRLKEANWIEPLLNAPLMTVLDTLTKIIECSKNEGIMDLFQDHKKRLQNYYNAIQYCLALQPEGHVFWLEKSGREGHIIALKTAPINIAEHLRECLFNQSTAVILTSATLAVNGEMENFQARIGAENEPEHIEYSPFDFENNVQIYIASDAPAPGEKDARLNRDFLSDRIGFCVNRVPGGTLVLFTSYTDLRAIGQDLEPIAEDLKRPLFIQGQGSTRTQLLEDFKQAGNGILLGTDSFWTGVDIPGPALSQVIITRLPFQNPGHPIVSAQEEWLRSQNKNPFNTRTLPDAIIKFRQGLGRLIRSQSDTGIITILDSRILNRSYGRSFIAALPKKTFERFDDSNKEMVFSCSLNNSATLGD